MPATETERAHPGRGGFQRPERQLVHETFELVTRCARMAALRKIVVRCDDFDLPTNGGDSSNQVRHSNVVTLGKSMPGSHTTAFERFNSLRGKRLLGGNG